MHDKMPVELLPFSRTTFFLPLKPIDIIRFIKAKFPRKTHVKQEAEKLIHRFFGYLIFDVEK